MRKKKINLSGLSGPELLSKLSDRNGIINYDCTWEMTMGWPETNLNTVSSPSNMKVPEEINKLRR